MYVHIHGHTHRSASYSTGDCLYSGWDTLVMNLSISWIPKDHGMRTCDFGTGMPNHSKASVQTITIYNKH